MYRHTIPPLLRSLKALSLVIAKAESHCSGRKIEPAALLGFRLYPDMLPFTKQVQLACDFAARTAARLAGAEIPSFADTETSFAELIARVGKVTSYIETFGPEKFEGAESRDIVMKMRNGDLQMTGIDYLTQFALPNYYFHAATAYGILRHNGVDLGKADFIGA